MADITATPDTVATKIGKLAAGDRLILSPGDYRSRLRFDGLRGTAENPILITGPRDAIFDGGRRVDDFMPEANAFALKQQLKNPKRVPGLGRLGHDGFLIFSQCRHVILEGISLRGCWPTAIAISQCRDLTFRDLDMQEGTFAFFAEGAITHGLTIEDCTWQQDITGTRLWRDTNWNLVHGPQPIGADDQRAWDGDFFRSFGIRGGVTIRGCTIKHAFNAIHMFHGDDDAGDMTLNRDVRIYDNRFSHIRDNAVEPEQGAWNWWIWHNDFHNCHKWLSLEMRRSGHFFVFGNTTWFDDIPSATVNPGDPQAKRLKELNTGGGVFKLPSSQIPSAGMHYVFNNSFYLRSGYAKKKEIRGLWHFGNAIQYCADHVPAPGPDKACDLPRPMFWQPDFTPVPGQLNKKQQLTTKWQALMIRFFADCVDHPDYPDGIIAAGYDRLEPGLGADPGFRDGARGRFVLTPGAAARGVKAGAQRLALSDGTYWDVPDTWVAGAYQGNRRVAPPDRIPGFADKEPRTA